MPNAPQMRTSTAVWLLNETSLTFDQIAKFCQLHRLEIQAIADGETAIGLKGTDPIVAGQVTREEIEKGLADINYCLKLAVCKTTLPSTKPNKGPRYAPFVKYWRLRP